MDPTMFHANETANLLLELLNVNPVALTSDPIEKSKVHALRGFAANLDSPIKHAIEYILGTATGSQAYWWDWYDVPGRLMDGFDNKNGDTMLVDVGGGKGHDLQVFHERFGTRFLGSVVLQESPDVIGSIHSDGLNSSIVRMEHDFFQPQPTKGDLLASYHMLLLIMTRRRSGLCPPPYPPRLV